LSLAIAACGGGGDSTPNTPPKNDPVVDNSTNNNSNTNNTTPQTPVAENNGLGAINNKLTAPIVNASVAKAGRFLFNWDFVPNAAYYRLMKSVDGKQPYQQVGEKLLTNSTTEDISTFEHDWANANYIVQACDAIGCSLSNKIYSGNVMLGMIAYVKDKALSESAHYDEIVKLAGTSTPLSDVHVQTAIYGVTADSFKISREIMYSTGCGYMYAYTCPSESTKNNLFSNLVSGDDWRFVDSKPQKPTYKSTNETTVKITDVAVDKNYETPVFCQGEGCLVVEEKNGDKYIVQGYSAEKVYYEARKSYTDAGLYSSSKCEINIKSSTGQIITADSWSFYPYQPQSYGTQKPIPQFCEDFSNAYSNSQLISYVSPLASVKIFDPVKDAFSEIKYVNEGTSHIIYAVRPNLLEVYEPTDGVWLKKYEEKTGGKLVVAVSSARLLLSDNSMLTKNATGQWIRTSLDFKVNDVVEYSKDFVLAKNDSGTLNVYHLNTEKATYEKQGELKSSNFDSTDGFGSAASVSQDGLTIAVGAPYEDSVAVGINGDQSNNKEKDSGAVYVFRFINNEWKQIAYVKATNTGANDNFGSSVGLSPDGKRLVVLAPNEASASTQNTGGNQQDNSKPKAGAVYVY
jgi:hypothetical protein